MARAGTFEDLSKSWIVSWQENILVFFENTLSLNLTFDTLLLIRLTRIWASVGIDWIKEMHIYIFYARVVG